MLRRYGLEGSGTATGTLETLTVVRNGRLKQLVIGVCVSKDATYTGGMVISLNRPDATFADLGTLADKNFFAMPLRATVLAGTTSYGEHTRTAIVIPCDDAVAINDVFYLNLTVSAGTPNVSISCIVVIDEK